LLNVKVKKRLSNCSMPTTDSLCNIDNLVASLLSQVKPLEIGKLGNNVVRFY